MIRKNLMKTLTVVMAAMLAVMTVACGATTTKDTTAITQESAADKALENTIVDMASRAGGATTDAGKVETVYVTANANGEVGDVIVSEWLKNADASKEIKDSTELKDIVNVKGSETFTESADGSVIWDAEGADIYYQGTTDKELPVKMKITYTLDGKEISPEELAGKSGKVTIRFDYENKDKKTVNVDGKDIEVYTPFAMVSGMMLDSDKFANVEVSNGKVISDGGKIVVMGVAVPGLKESLDISDEKWEELDEDGKIEDKLSDHFEVTADVNNFELGMTITMASSDILNDFGMSELTGSDKINDLKSDMGELKDGSTKLVDGTKTLKDGTSELREGVGKLADGSQQLADGTNSLYDGTKSLVQGTGELANGSSQLASGSRELANGTAQLSSGSKELADGTAQLSSGSKELASGTSQLSGGAKELASGTKELADGTKTLAAGGDTLYGGLTEYLSATKQIQEGAAALAEGAGSAKAGSEQLVAGMDQADIVNNAAALATGSAQVSAGVNEVVTKLSAMSGLMTKKQEISSKYEAFCHAKAFLEGTEECSETVVQALYFLSDGKIADAATAIDIRNTGLAALQGNSTGSVSQEENGEELVVGAEYGVLTADENTPEGGDDAAGNGAGDEDGNGGQPAASDEGGNGGQPAGDGESGNDGQPAGDDNNAGSGNTGDSAGSGNTGDNANAGSTDDNANNGNAGDDANKEGAGDNINNGNAGDNNNGGAEGTITLTQQQLEDMLREAAQKAADEAQKKTTEALMAKVKAETEAKTAETTVLIQKIALYSGTYGAAKAATQILGETLETLSAVDFSEATLTQLQTLKAGAEQVAAGNAQMAEGIKNIHAGAQKLDAGIGTLSAGATKLSEGTKTLVSNNDKLNGGAESLVAGAKRISDGAVAVNEGAGKLSAGADQLNAGASKLSDGASQVNTGAAKLSDGAGQLNAGAGKLADGAAQLDEGVGKLNSGAGELNDGAKKLSDGAGELNDGVKELADGSVKLDDGVQELLEGMIKFDKEGIEKLYEAFDGDLTEFADRITAIQEAGKGYTSFGGSSEEEHSSVKFIIKTDSIKTL